MRRLSFFIKWIEQRPGKKYHHKKRYGQYCIRNPDKY
jgi:hypothetical protein